MDLLEKLLAARVWLYVYNHRPLQIFSVKWRLDYSSIESLVNPNDGTNKKSLLTGLQGIIIMG